MKVTSLSVFFPAYNEEKNIGQTLEQANEVLKGLNLKNYEIIVIDDGSKDKTGEIVKKLQKNNRYIRLITHNPNKGYGEALKSGFYNSKYDWITFTDADGQFDFSEINKFIEKEEETNADLVIGFYLDRKVSISTKITSKVWELVIFMLFGLKVKDIDCGFKLISKRVIEKMSKLRSQRGAFISSELLIKAKKARFKIVEVGVHHYPRAAGKGTGRSVKVIVKSFINLFELWWQMK
ncbi:MAG: glycosyltransferase family 2 protein [Candidatus Daviesbacteria bacterium]